MADLVHIEDAVMTSLRQLLMQLLEVTERQTHAALWFYPNKPPRTAWILLPASDGRFDCAFRYPSVDSYQTVQQRHRPAQWNTDVVAEIDGAVAKAKARLKGTALKEELLELRKRFLGGASLTGYVYHFGGPSFFPSIDVAEADTSYMQWVESEKFHFRSGAGIRLDVGSKPLGVLMLYDTVRDSFLPADAGPLEIYGRLLGPSLQMAVELGLLGPAGGK